MVEVPRLSDGTVVLRAHTDEDRPAVVEQSLDPLSRRWTTVPLRYGPDDARRFVREIMPGGWATDQEWGFAVEVDGRYAATVSLRNRDDGRAEIAYGSHPWVRGTGHVGRALRMLLDWGFAARGLETVVWWANRGNWASRKTAWRLGFSFDGTVRRWLPDRGELTDGWVGTLLRGDPRTPRGTWLDVPTLRSDRVGLRPLADTDVPRIVEACRDPVTRHWLAPLPSPYAVEDALAWLEESRERAAAGTRVTWAVHDAGASGRLVGALNLFQLRLGAEGEVGYWTHPDARGRGVMSAAVALALDHAFDTLDLSIVRVVAALDNAPSRAVIERNGFRLAGTERRGTLLDDGWADTARYDLTDAEWRGLSRQG